MPKGSSSSSSSGQQLHDACISGDHAAVRKLLDEGVNVNWKNEEGRTGLMLASANGRVEVIKLLLDRGADIDIQDRDYGWTALIWASYFGRVDCARLLLERGADMSIQDFDGETARDQAMEQRQVGIVLLLDEYEAKKKTTPHTHAMSDLVLPQTQISPPLVIIPQTQALTEVALPQAQVVGELVMEPINKALQEENTRLKIEIEVLKERELSKTKEMLLKQELVDEYKARAKNVEEENQKAKDEIQRARDEVSSLKEKEAAMKVEIEYLKRRDEELRLERNTERAERSSERAMFQTMMSSLISGTEDRKRKRDEDEATK